jgi:putative component of membrane protein insertase Oxa1/YidC/SpoIIIJ protein YidD
MLTNAILTFPRQTASSLITIYQKHISPHKGFSCAYRVMSHGESCSQYTKRLILEQGLGRSLPLIRERFQACKAASQTLKARRQHCRTIQSENSEENNEMDVPDAGQEPADDRARQPKNNGRSSGSRSVTNSADTSNFCADSSCDSLYCADLGCDAIDCTSVECGAIDCGSLDCGGADCSSFDCGDCSGCGDFGSCSS